MKNPLKLKTDTTTYLYDGFTNAITNEYTGNGSPLSQYNMANDRIVSKKTFGNHGQVIPGREPSLKTNGGLMYYSYDGMRNVTELTDRHGDSIEQYRYDAFGGLYTGVTAPYNTNSFAGKNYDAKANLIDMNARWYGAQNGRFTTADPYTGDILTPYTQNRYAYVGNNPINRWDPLGYWEDGDSSLSSAAQADIRYLTKLYNSTDDKDERESLHEAANEIRNLDRDRWTTEDERKIGSWSGTPDIDYDTSIKLSDGWRTDWTRTDKYYEKYEVTRQRHTAYAGVISTTVSVRTDTTTTVTHGFDFRAFTPSEWYQENKAVLRQYNIPISQVNSYYEPKDAYSKTIASLRSITSTEKIVSRNDNNDYKNGIISQGLEVAGVSDFIKDIGKHGGASGTFGEKPGFTETLITTTSNSIKSDLDAIEGIFNTDKRYATEDFLNGIKEFFLEKSPEEKAQMWEDIREDAKEDSNVYAMVIGGLIGIDDLSKIGKLDNISDMSKLYDVGTIAGRMDLAGKIHPVSGVKFDSKGFPVFDSKFTATLDSSLYTASDYKQFKNATDQLNQTIITDPILKDQFSENQLQQISKGIKPDGYTWHHHQDTGIIQLVDYNLHQQTGHLGGRNIWGGGSANR